VFQTAESAEDAKRMPPTLRVLRALCGLREHGVKVLNGTDRKIEDRNITQKKMRR
jgi:hypothetical protein